MCQTGSPRHKLHLRQMCPSAHDSRFCSPLSTNGEQAGDYHPKFEGGKVVPAVVMPPQAHRELQGKQNKTKQKLLMPKRGGGGGRFCPWWQILPKNKLNRAQSGKMVQGQIVGRICHQGQNLPPDRAESDISTRLAASATPLVRICIHFSYLYRHGMFIVL